jgi:outer membrane lipoprotein-sorting protein
MKQYMTSGLIVALIAIGVAMGCGSGEVEPKPTPDATLTPTGEIGELPGTYKYSMAWSDSDGETVSMDVWVKGDKSRVDMSQTVPGWETETIIFLDDSQFEWMYYPDENQAYKWLRDDQTSGMADAYTWWFTEYYYGTVLEGTILADMQASCAIEPICSSVAITGHDTISGQSCTEFTATATHGGMDIYWISNSGWLMKLYTIDATGYSVTMEYIDIDLNPSISNDAFDIDTVAPGAEIIDMTEW